MRPDWSPDVYARHAGPRLRPAIDLLARVPLQDARSVVDLGCGGGALFPALRNRFPQARLTGIDSSAAMLARARQVDGEAELVEADAGVWRPAAPVDLIIANASLQWIPNHETLISALLACCRCLAVQVPDNFSAPSHTLVRRTMRQPEWHDRLVGIEHGRFALPAEAYARLLDQTNAECDLWRTTYYHRLTGRNAVLDWLRGTTLLPIVAALGGAESPDARAFEAALRQELATAYPADHSGRVRFPFTRLFFVATRRAA